ncbi:PQQ-binding-like beta-propeller repeat protein [Ornithinibacillus gellani]|nr:PQQ-binding-like beta-propeller repeat protein [Ornithinibacillus gellani]
MICLVSLSLLCEAKKWNYSHRERTNMKKIGFILVMGLAFFIVTGCSDGADEKEKENQTAAEEDVDSAQGVEDEKAVDAEETDGESEAADDTFLGTIDDTEVIALEDYPEENWLKLETEEDVQSRAFLDGDTVYTITRDDEAVAYSTDGKKLWQSEALPYPIRRTVVLTEDYLLINTETSEGETAYIEALDKKTGKSVYRINLDKYNDLSELYVLDDAIYFAAGIRSNPDDLLFSDTFTFHKHSLKDGKAIWEKDIDMFTVNTKGALFQFAQKDDLFYYVNEDSEIVALDKETGEQAWAVEGPEKYRYTLPFLSEDKLYVMGQEVIWSYDAATGDKISEFAFEGGVTDFASPYPAFHGSTVVYQDVDFDTGLSTIWAADLDQGEEIWSVNLPEEDYLYTAHMMNDTLYLLTEKRDKELEEPTKVIKLDPESGKQLESIALDEKVGAGPGSVYISADSHQDGAYISAFYDDIIYFIK